MKQKLSFRIKAMIQAGANSLGYEIRRIPQKLTPSDRSGCPMAISCLYEDVHLLGRVHRKDQMFVGNAEHYITVGLSAMDNIGKALQVAGKTFEDVTSCLDMACGYGRVLRLLRLRIDPKRITACDIDEEAVDFCSSEFGVEPLISQEDFRALNFPRKYDLIWVGSLATHVTEASFRELLEVLFDILDDNGVLVFSTHGEYSIEVPEIYGVEFPPKEELRRILKEDGYFFMPYEGSEFYGISLCSKDYILSVAEHLFGQKLVLLVYAYRGWSSHHDVYSFQKMIA